MLKSFFHRFNASSKSCLFAGIFLLVLLGINGDAVAQGIERDSMAGESASELAHAENADNQAYNLQIGPVTLRAAAGGAISYNDNIGLAKIGRQSDWIFAPRLDLSGVWQISDLNALSFDLGISYEEYLEHSANNAFVISPNSETHFNIFVDDFKINLHDRFSYQNDPIQVGQLSNVSQFDRFNNDAGVEVDWDLGDLVTSLSYDHNNFWVFEQQFNYLDYQSDVVAPEVNFKLSKTVHAGLNASFNDTRYDKNIQNNYTEFRIGPFVNAELTNKLSVNAQGGWDYATYEHGGLNGDTSNINSFYASAGANHRINDVLTEGLTAGREFIPGITSNYTQRTYVNYTPDWQATSFLNVSPELWWENLDDSGATFHENSNRFGASLLLNFALNTHANINLNYNYVIKSSDQSALNYYQDVVTLGFNYQF